MGSKTLDVVSVITAIVLVQMVGVSVHAYVDGVIPFSEYVALWREPLALLLGFWLRGVKET